MAAPSVPAHDYAGMRSWELVDAVQRGDHNAFGELHARYQGMVLAYVSRRVQGHHLAEDLAADAFANAFAAIHRLRFQGRDVGAWLMTIARNLIFDHVKRSSTRCEVFDPTLFTDLQARTNTEEEVLTALDREAARIAVRRAVSTLSPGQRECIQLRFGHELSVADVSEAMGRATGAVKALQHRAVRNLAPRLSRVADAYFSPDGGDHHAA